MSPLMKHVTKNTCCHVWRSIVLHIARCHFRMLCGQMSIIDTGKLALYQILGFYLTHNPSIRRPVHILRFLTNLFMDFNPSSFLELELTCAPRVSTIPIVSAIVSAFGVGSQCLRHWRCRKRAKVCVPHAKSLWKQWILRKSDECSEKAVRSPDIPFKQKSEQRLMQQC